MKKNEERILFDDKDFLVAKIFSLSLSLFIITFSVFHYFDLETSKT